MKLRRRIILALLLGSLSLQCGCLHGGGGGGGGPIGDDGFTPGGGDMSGPQGPGEEPMGPGGTAGPGPTPPNHGPNGPAGVQEGAVGGVAPGQGAPAARPREGQANLGAGAPGTIGGNRSRTATPPQPDGENYVAGAPPTVADSTAAMGPEKANSEPGADQPARVMLDKMTLAVIEAHVPTQMIYAFPPPAVTNAQDVLEEWSRVVEKIQSDPSDVNLAVTLEKLSYYGLVILKHYPDGFMDSPQGQNAKASIQLLSAASGALLKSLNESAKVATPALIARMENGDKSRSERLEVEKIKQQVAMNNTYQQFIANPDPNFGKARAELTQFRGDMEAKFKAMRAQMEASGAGRGGVPAGGGSGAGTGP